MVGWFTQELYREGLKKSGLRFLGKVSKEKSGLACLFLPKGFGKLGYKKLQINLPNALCPSRINQQQCHQTGHAVRGWQVQQKINIIPKKVKTLKKPPDGVEQATTHSKWIR